MLLIVAQDRQLVVDGLFSPVLFADSTFSATRWSDIPSVLSDVMTSPATIIEARRVSTQVIGAPRNWFEVVWINTNPDST
jgi:hypothetical protein